jgi:hypothetical protein
MRVSRNFIKTTPVWRYQDNSIYLAINGRSVIEPGEPDGVHITRVNVPAKFETDPNTGNVQSVTFLDGAMMQLAVYGDADTDSEGWTVTKQGNETIFTKFGSAETLVIRW